MKKLNEEKRRALSAVLKGFYDAIAAEPVPQSIHDQLRGLK